MRFHQGPGLPAATHKHTDTHAWYAHALTERTSSELLVRHHLCVNDKDAIDLLQTVFAYSHSISNYIYMYVCKCGCVRHVMSLEQRLAGGGGGLCVD